MKVDIGIGQVFDFAESIITRIWPDANEADKRKINAILQTTLAVHATNTAQAQHSHWFVAGARPGVMWICAAGLAWDFVVWPFAAWFSRIFEIAEPPTTDSEVLLTLLFSLLGVARTFEKFGGVARGNLSEPIPRKTGVKETLKKMWPSRRTDPDVPRNDINDSDFYIGS